HHYVFTLCALDATLPLGSGVKKEAVTAAMAGHVLGQAQLVGRYGR
ncbi:MAG: hypothetical protein JWM80_4872, partial [Cyanobacteria bacterium RYN_339]|nr:hypothetical protein [Cyanobacteria bacterium RYN_339]